MSGGAYGNAMRPDASHGGIRGDVACGVYIVTPKQGHWAVRFPRGNERHVHAGCVVKTLAKGAAPAPLRRPAGGCGARRTRRDVLVAAVKVDPGLRADGRGGHGRRSPAQTGALVQMGP